MLEMQQAVKNIRVDDSLVNYALEIVRRTRESEFLSLGVSPRGSQALYRAAQAMAFLEGRCLLHSGRFQATGRASLRASRGRKQFICIDAEEVRAVRSGFERDDRQRRGACVEEVASGQ